MNLSELTTSPKLLFVLLSQCGDLCLNIIYIVCDVYSWRCLTCFFLTSVSFRFFLFRGERYGLLFSYLYIFFRFLVRDTCCSSHMIVKKIYEFRQFSSTELKETYSYFNLFFTLYLLLLLLLLLLLKCVCQWLFRVT